ncbi:bridge-like lipid transfer protein family member 3B [Oppia nitens]|uniref:bridge-like lipid transfer protein family member 3B n=1 Tax=Oppia nitens TaxID=1686743 RepID=UPI0023DBB5CD|nr:bridge-like lipid transfer protein family member 3B [Oppia nitens]
MAALLKNQVLKHLSKFTKNLSPDKLNISAIKGCCDVHNIELNEEVLMDLLELPVWMSLSRAFVNHVSLKVQWMKLKTLPIYLALDEVVVDIETVEDFRSENTRLNTNHSSYNDSGKYGFADRVFDGMTVSINSVVVTFRSKVFIANLQLSRLLVESRAPNWKRNSDLRLTRIKDPNRGQILIFKHLEWQTLRFEAKSESNIVQTPLRLIANQASCRITLKKRLSDCALLGARLMVIFDDLLWVLTDAQLLSALHFADYLAQLIKRAPRTKNFVDELVVSSQSPTFSSLKNLSTQSAQTAQSAISRLFSQHDIFETSHHIFVSRIEVHLCDDLDPTNGRSQHPSLKDGGALQITISKLVIDLYPYQKVVGNRNHWIRYSDPSSSRHHWISEHLQSFAEKRAKTIANLSINHANRPQTRSALNQLMSRVILIRLADYSISCVTTNTTTKHKLIDKLIATDKSAPLPDDMMAFYMEVNSYYYIDSNETVPEPTAFVHLAPLKIHFDPLTVLWLNAFHANLHKAMVKLQEMIPKQETQRLLTRLECLMPIISIKCPEDSEFSYLELKSARIVAMNCETENSSFAEIDQFMEMMGSSPFIYDRQAFPWLESDPKPVSEEFFTNLTKLKTKENETDVWTVRMEPLWVEFRNRKNNKFQPLLDPIPITLWAFESPINDNKITINKSDPDLSLILCISSLIKVQLNHSQYLFLMRFLEQMSEFGAQMTSDTIRIQNKDSNSLTNIFKCISLITTIPNIELVLKLDEEFQTQRSIGVSPQQSVLDFSSPIMNDKSLDENEINKLMNNNNSNDKLVDTSYVSKSHSDSLLSGSSNFDINNSVNNTKLSKNDFMQKDTIDSAQSTSLTTIPAHIKLHNTSVISFKKNIAANLDTVSFKSNSTFNESGLADSCSSPIDDDNRSIRSDLSAESDQFIVVGFETISQEEDEDIFGMTRVETADEVKEDSNVVDTPSEDSDANSASHNTSLDNPISVTLIKINISNLSLVHQSKGYHSKICLRASDILLSEFIKMPFNDYQTLINQRVSNKIKNIANPKTSEVLIRLESYAKLNSKDELVSVVANDVDVELHMDSVMLLNDFITDTDMVYVPPTNISVNNVCVTLVDDKVSTPPLVLNIEELFIERDKSNRMKIYPLFKNAISDVSAHTKRLTVPHLKLRQRNDETIDLDLDKHMIYSHNNDCRGDDKSDVLQQVINRNEILLQEIQTLKLENNQLSNKLKDITQSRH